MKKLKCVKRNTSVVIVIAIIIITSIVVKTYGWLDTSSIVKRENNRTGVNLNVVTIDDYEKDYNYYMGKNYTESNDGTLPMGINQEIYNDDNLIKVEITYKGSDISNDSLVGYVSDIERQDTFVYYKYYPIENGYINIELIDNPFTDTPNGKGFNGWITDYPGAKITYDKTYYKRYAKIPVSGDKIEIKFNASWAQANVIKKGSSDSWSTVFSSLSRGGMERINGQTVNVYEDVTNFYTYDYVGFNETFPNGAVNSNGNDISGTRCNSYYCTYYNKVQENDYDSNTTYYEINNGQMVHHTIEVIDQIIIPSFDAGTIMAGYYKLVNINYGASIAGYYDANGELKNTGTCTNNSGCQYYELIQYYDENNQVNISTENTVCYKLITRDLNIIVMTGNTSSSWQSSQNKPFTLTSKYNDEDYTQYYWDISSVAVNCYNDTKIENITIYSNDSSKSTTPSGNTGQSGYLYGNYHNVKIGRGILQLSSSKNFDVIIGGDNGTNAIGSANNTIKYHLEIASGYYNSVVLTNGQPRTNTNNNKYIEAKATYGNDYDKATLNNDSMDVYFVISSSFGLGTYYSSNQNSVSFDTIVKSGKFGSQAGSDHTSGIYVGGRGYGTHSTVRKIKVEGGWIYNLIGGPLTASSRANINDTYIEMTGGAVDFIVGGAGTSATYGNRIISVTGGIVNYSVFGGSNGYDGSNGDGTLNGDSFIYIGGTATIGNESLIISGAEKWGVESGSVFGIGNGNQRVASIGSTDNSNIIIDGEAHILKNVYGGGNYGATGISSTSNTNSTSININGGTIEGSIYGGGNNNGAGTSTKISTINIKMFNGTIRGSIYGGSRTIGTVYGSVNININGGQIDNSVYGGGEGGYASLQSSGTFVTGNINITIGDDSSTIDNLHINKSVYGGSAFGTVNSQERTTAISNSTTKVMINNGQITNVYGGGEGNDDYIPYVCGNITVDINGGKIENVFGGNDLKGTPNGKIEVNINNGQITNAYAGGNYAETTNPKINLKGGVIENAYGGGNNAKVSSSNVLVDGSTITNVYGGSNISGDVSNSEVIINSGIVTKVFGGNNVDGKTDKTYVEVNGGSVDDVYGGGEKTDVTTTTNISINSTVKNVFGGSDLNGIVKNTKVNINSEGIAEIVYGGNNLGGKTITSNVTVNGGKVKETYGGGLRADTDNTNVTFINNGQCETIYGGGNKGNVNKNTIIKITQSEISKNIYGGGNAADVKADTKVIINNSSISENIYGGGNNGIVLQNTSLTITNSEIGKSAYAGGNGSTAVVLGNSKINVEGTTIIHEHVFGGGKAAATGCNSSITNSFGEEYNCSSPNSSNSEVNISGATIGGNVYGGANTSVVYGVANVNIGIKAIANDLIEGNINISGNIFGGGEANYEGSEDYDFNFISVTEGININIDGDTNNDYQLDGSIFGSGNASSSGGYSYINISNYGNTENPKRNISIQRTDVVTLNNSSILLFGAKDRTNKYKNELFTLSRIGKLKLKNNSTLFLEKGTNLLESFASLVDVNGKEKAAEVIIEDTQNIVSKNVDNRIYMFEGKNLNISDDESLATFGDVEGMTFFGMFKYDRNGNIATGLYSNNYNNGDIITGSELYYFSSGSYVVAKHKNAHDIYLDGFYSNFANNTNNGIEVRYIEPTPSDATYYRWVIGESVEVLELNLTASKYLTLGTSELQLMNYYQPNTEIYILGVNFDHLSSDVNILPSEDIPRYASNVEEANKNFGLGMKTGKIGWITKNGTEFSTEESKILGATRYKAENSNAIPSFIFYLYHSKNISETRELGTVTISMMAVIPIDELNNQIKRINVEVNMNCAFYEGDNYEASISPGPQYEMFANSNVNITNKSTFSSYFSLFVPKETSIYKEGYTRSLISNYAYPENTKITMIDFASSDKPEYYYYIIDSNSYNDSVNQLLHEGEISYKLSNFIKMGSPSINNTYDDAIANEKYYNANIQTNEEEFIFIVDFSESNITENVINKTLLIELRDSDDNPVIPVLDISQQKMFYNLYDNKDAEIELNVSLSSDTFYMGQKVQLNATTNFSQQKIGNVTIIDTNYYNKRLGIKLSLYNGDNQMINGAELLGTSFIYDGVKYYPRQDGTVRFNIAETIANVSSKITIDMEKSNISNGNYTMVIETFGSPDGIYYGLDETNKVEKEINIVNEKYGLDISMPDADVIIDKKTGLSSDKNNYIDFQCTYESAFKMPNIRISMYRRTYNDIYDYDYDLVDIKDYVTNELSESNEEKVYIAKNFPTNRFQYILNMKDNLITGTYQIRFSLYDNNICVGYVTKYIIIE